MSEQPVVAARFPRLLHGLLIDYATQHGISVSDVVRGCVDIVMNNQGDPRVIGYMQGLDAGRAALNDFATPIGDAIKHLQDVILRQAAVVAVTPIPHPDTLAPATPPGLQPLSDFMPPYRRTG